MGETRETRPAGLGLTRSVRAAGGVVWRRDAGDRLEVLLVHRPEYDDWTLPKGKNLPGEDDLVCALREVAEETGYRLAEGELLGPIARRHVVHGYSDLVIEQDESFFLAMVSPFEVDVSAHTADERLTMLGHRWWTHDDLRHTDDWIWPHELVELWSLAGRSDIWPIDLGTQEESTVLDVA